MTTTTFPPPAAYELGCEPGPLADLLRATEHGRGMLFCLIDADAAYRQMLRYHLEVEWPDAKITEFEVITNGVPSAAALAGCDAVLLGCPRPGREGFKELRHLLDRRLYPPVLIFAESGDELVAVDALKAGAASYFPKGRVTHQRLIETLRAEIGAPRQLPGSAALASANASQFRYLKELHSTELATVYLAEPLDASGVKQAVKVIRYVPDAGGGRLFDRFLQEFEIIAGIDNRNVVKIFDLGVADDHAYIAMEYLAAGRLSDRLRGAIPVDQALDYLTQVASALEAVHAAGILHRDLKPANIMFRDDGSLALIDFGFAKRMTLEAALTGHGQIFGTPYYMSPEQGHAEATDQRADLYSLGCIVHEMLTGRRPFVGSTAMGVIYQHANAPRPKLPRELAAEQPMLDRLLAVDRAERFQSAAELLAAIKSRGA
jgi:DNA-binding NarL/FixJ family response regulator